MYKEIFRSSQRSTRDDSRSFLKDAQSIAEIKRFLLKIRSLHLQRNVDKVNLDKEVKERERKGEGVRQGWGTKQIRLFSFSRRDTRLNVFVSYGSNPFEEITRRRTRRMSSRRPLFAKVTQHFSLKSKQLMFPASQLVQSRGELERSDVSSDSGRVPSRERERGRKERGEGERDARNFSRKIRKKQREKFLFKNVESVRLSSCSRFPGPRQLPFWICQIGSSFFD